MSEEKKILLLEDRPGRQSQFLGKIQIGELKELAFLEFPQTEDCINLIKAVNERTADLEQYELIIVHRTSLRLEGINYLKSLKKALILFSGGLSQMVYQNDGFPVLSINSAGLYNKNFMNFIKKYAEGKVKNLTELIYGDKWELSLLLQYRMIKTKLEQESDNFVRTQIEEQLKTLENNFERFPDDINKEIDKQILAI